MRKQAADLGVPPERIHIYFRRTLCSELRKPRYARFWAEHLGLSTFAWPFTAIEDVRQLYGRGTNNVTPTKAEYDEHSVHTPGVLPDIEKALIASGVSLVRGKGASGKTTLAVLLSRRAGFSSGRTYYLDFTGRSADDPFVPRAIDAMSVFGDQNTLFVLDNAHLVPDLAAYMIRHWRTVRNGSRLLLLARMVRRVGVTWRVDADGLDSDVPTFDLAITPTDLEGAFTRLHRRVLGRDPAPASPDRLAEWAKAFGGDLIAFSAAVLHRLHDPSWSFDIRAEDASEYVRSEYLYKPDLQGEVESLLDLAVLGVLEVSLPVKALPFGALGRCADAGIVWVEEKGANARYRLPHPGLARLLVAAAGLNDGQVARRRRDVLTQTPSAFVAAYEAVASLVRADSRPEATALIGALWTKQRWPLASLPVFTWRTAVALTLESGVLDQAQLQLRAEMWVRAAGVEVLDPAVLRSPLGSLKELLRFLAASLPPVWAAMRAALARAPNQERLMIQVLGASPDQLTDFLRYAQRSMFDVWKGVCAALEVDGCAEVMASTTLTSSPGHAVAFLRYSASVGRLQKVRMNLLRLLTSLDRRRELLAWLVGAGPDQIPGLCNEAPEFEALVAEIDIEAWSERWSSAPLGTPHWFISFAQLCNGHGRSDLARIVADNIVAQATYQELNESSINLRHVTFILGTASLDSADRISKFLTRCVSSEAVAIAYSSPGAGLGPLAASARAAAMNDSFTVRRFFAPGPMYSRLWSDWPRPDHDVQRVSDWFQLFAAARVLDDSVPLPVGPSMPLDRVRAALTVGPPMGAVGIQPQQGWLWLGLHEWLYLKEADLKVALPLITHTLQAFRDGDPVGRQRLAQLNAAMTGWLEVCARRGVLERPTASLASILKACA